ncbi:hypothetical protein GQ457_14G020760 [Hibiscus cannabinus]
MGRPGPAIHTDLILENNTGYSLALFDKVDWYGSANPPSVIQRRMPEKIKHQADSQTGCSKGGVVYTIRKNIRWLVAWSNMKDEDNKYTRGGFWTSAIGAIAQDPKRGGAPKLERIQRGGPQN